MNLRLLRLKELLFGANKICPDRGYPALTSALEKITGRKKSAQLLREIPDKRNLMQEAARLTNQTEDQLIKDVAELLELPVLFRLKPFNLTILPEHISLNDLRKSGVCPLLNQNEICGIACVDPAELAALDRLYNGNNIYLTSWQAVLSVLEQSEQLYLLSKTEAEQQKLESQKEIFNEILLRLSYELEIKKSSLLQFNSEQSEVSYQFTDSQGLEWDGNIDSSISAQFIEYLQQQIASGHSDIIDKNGVVVSGLSASQGQLFLRLIKSDKKLKEIPLVILTTEEGQESELRALDLGADAFVTKTKDPRILKLHLNRLLKSRVAA